MYSGFEFTVKKDSSRYYIYPTGNGVDDIILIWKHHLKALAAAIGLDSDTYLYKLPTGEVKRRLKALAKAKTLPHTRVEQKPDNN